jgi:hypothetical protein
VTPVAKWPMTRRSSCGSIDISSFQTGTRANLGLSIRPVDSTPSYFVKGVANEARHKPAAGETVSRNDVRG